MPRVTIGMPVYNSDSAYFRAALASLLGQSLGDFELLISDNGSGPEAEALYRDAAKLDRRVRYIRHATNRGSAFNFNYLVEAASSEYLLWAADDDLRHPDYLTRTTNLLDSHAEAVAAASEVATIDADGQPLWHCPMERADSPRVWRRLAALVSPFNCYDIYALHRLEALRKTRLFRVAPAPDILLLQELLVQGSIQRVPEELCFYRVNLAQDRLHVYARVAGREDLPFDIVYLRRDVGLRLLGAILRSTALHWPIRWVCVVAVLQKLLREEWLTRERREVLNAQIKESFLRGQRLRAAFGFAEYLLLSPLAPLRRSFWRALRAARADIGQRGGSPQAPGPHK